MRAANRRRVLVLLLVLGAPPAQALEAPAPGSLEPGTLTLPSGPASVQGLADAPDLDVFTGQAGYTVPVELPAGPGGFAPAGLKLVHDGALGNGPLGVGWHLGPLEIRRRLDQGVPSYDDGDTFELRGAVGSGRLRPLPDGTWRLEGAGQSVKVQRSGEVWLATDPLGTRYWFGATPEGRQGGSNGTQAWLLQRIEDLAGHAARVWWVHDQGQIYLGGMAWGPDEIFQVSLEYESRRDAVVSWRAGFEVTTALRLAAIVVRSQGEVLRALHFSYDPGWSLSRLSGIRFTGRGGEGELRPLGFEYGTREPAAVEEISGVAYTLNQPDMTLADVDGDGVSDLVRLALGDHHYWRNLGGHLAEGRPLTGAEDVALSGGTSRLMDVDGDARPELVRELTGWRVHRLDSETFAAAEPWADTDGEPLVDPATAFADLNGDGRTDLLRASGAGLGVRLAYDGGLGPLESRPPVTDGEVLQPGMEPVSFQDFNGDGLADCVVTGLDSLRVFHGRGDGTFAPSRTVALPFQAPDPGQVRLADLDRDGLTDVLHVEAGQVTWYPMDGSGALSGGVSLPRPPGLDASVVVTTGDLNGNGSTDLVWSTLDRMWLLDFAGPLSGAMMVRLKVGLGRTLDLDYAPSAWLAFQAEADGDPWSSALPVSVPVVVETREGIAGEPAERVTRLLPRDGVYDGAERRFAGFLESRRTQAGEDAAGTLVERLLHHPGLGADRALRGKVWRTEQRDGDGRLLTRSDTAWEAVRLDGFPDDPLLRVAQEGSVVQEVWEGGDTPISTRVGYGYDGEGNRTETADEGRLDLEGDESVERVTFAANDATWVRAKPVETIVETWDGTPVSRARILYDGDTDPLPFGQVGAGWARRTEGWYAEESRWVLQEGTDFDAHGNAVRIWDKGVWRAVTYDARGLHPVAEQVGADGVTLTWQAEWDEVAGLATALTDPAGVTRRVRYDALGRPAALTVAGTAVETYAYDWLVPRPRTWTTLHDGDLGERVQVAIHNGAGEAVVLAHRLGEGRWLVSEHRVRGSRGWPLLESEPFEWDGADPADASPGQGGGTRLRYDAVGRTLVEIRPDGSQERQAHLPFARQRTPDGLASVTTEVDGKGRPLRTHRMVSGVSEVVDSAYDPEGRLLRLDFQEGAAWQAWRYDSLGHLVSLEGSDHGARSYAWDDAGRLLSEVNGEGQTLHYAYGPLGRLVELAVDGAGVFRFTYDAPVEDGPAVSHAQGRLTRVDGPQGSSELAYDAWGRVVWERRRAGEVVALREQTLSPGGTPVRVRYDGEVELEHGHDAAGRLTSVHGPGGLLWEAVELDPAGRLLADRFGNGLTGRYGRDLLGALTGVEVGGGDAAVLDLAITRNVFGAPVSVEDRDGAGLDHSATYSYDEGARITGAALGGYVFSYAYDALQNRTRRSVEGPASLPGLSAGVYRYGEGGAGPRQLTDAAGLSLSWDTAGRAVVRGTTELSYDARDRVTELALADGRTLTHGYDHAGRRVVTRLSDGTTETWPFEEVRDADGRRSYYVTVGARLVARVDVGAGGLAATEAGVWPPMGLGLFLLAASLGLGSRRWRTRLGIGGALFVLSSAGCASPPPALSVLFFHYGVGAGPALLTDEQGAVVDERRYEPFGTPLDLDEPVDPHGWTNKPVDPLTGDADHGARWLSTDLGIWFTPDPATLTPGEAQLEAPWRLAPYAFANQNPLSHWDPDGRDAILIEFPAFLLAGKIPVLGHTGILLIDDDTGAATYYEFGMDYGDAGTDTASYDLGTLDLREDGRPTLESLAGAFETISQRSGQGGPIWGAYLETSLDQTGRMRTYASSVANGTIRRGDYNVVLNNCAHFASDVAWAGGVFVPRETIPVLQMTEATILYESVTYRRTSEWTLVTMRRDSWGGLVSRLERGFFPEKEAP